MTVTTDRNGTTTIDVNVDRQDTDAATSPTQCDRVVVKVVTTEIQVSRTTDATTLTLDFDLILKQRVLWDVAHHPGSDAFDVADRVGASAFEVAEIMDELAERGILGVVG